MIQALVADDEPLARRKLRDLLCKFSDVGVVGEAASGHEVLDLLRNNSPQLLFLDVRMPGEDAFGVIDRITSDKTVTMPRIIFTTAYDQYALRAFQVNATDYLLKPFTLERLDSAIRRVRDELQWAPAPEAENTLPGSNSNGHLTRVAFKSRGRILFLRVSDIRWIGAEENYVRISTGTESHLLRETISSMEERLDPSEFLRVHRSVIVNLRFVKEVRAHAHGEYSVLMQNGEKVAMSRSHYSRIRGLLDQH
jgi:two-component system LytT family response regulator